jgi:hypothetical protein
MIERYSGYFGFSVQSVSHDGHSPEKPQPKPGISRKGAKAATKSIAISNPSAKLVNCRAKP